VLLVGKKQKLPVTDRFVMLKLIFFSFES